MYYNCYHRMVIKYIPLREGDESLFGDELLPANFTFYNKHLQAFGCMWRDQVGGRKRMQYVIFMCPSCFS